MSRAVGEVFEVSLSLGQGNFSAAQAKRTDGTGFPSVARAGQSATPEVAASLRRLEGNQIGRAASRVLVAKH